MAKPSWLSINPSTGSGNGTISNTAQAHTGRVQRTGTVTVTGNGVSTPATYKVTQEAKPEFAEFSNGPEMAAPKGAGKVTVSGKSNSTKLSFAFVGDSNGVELPASYSAAGGQVDNGEAVAGDPGAQAEYLFSVELQLPDNDTIEEVERTIAVTANGGQAAQIVIKQAAGDARLSVEPTEITIPQDGSAVSVEVQSNTSWSVA